MGIYILLLLGLFSCLNKREQNSTFKFSSDDDMEIYIEESSTIRESIHKIFGPLESAVLQRILERPKEKIVNILKLVEKEDYNQAIDEASENGYIDLLRLVIDYKKENYKGPLPSYGGFLKKSIYALVEEDKKRAFEIAAGEGHEDIVKMMMDKVSSHFRALKISARKGHIGVMKSILEVDENEDNVDEILEIAVNKGNVEMVELLLEKYEIEDEALNYAAFEGQREIVDLIIKRGEANYIVGLSAAAEGGQKEIVELMLEKGADDYILAVSSAALGGKKEIVDLLLEKDSHSDEKKEELINISLLIEEERYDEAMIWGAERGHINLVQLMRGRARNKKEAMKCAAQNGHEEIVDLMAEYVSEEDTLEIAAQGGCINIVKRMFEKGVDIYEDSMERLLDNYLYSIQQDLFDIAVRNDHGHLVEQLMSITGDIRLREGIRIAAENGHEEILDLVLSRANERDRRDCYWYDEYDGYIYDDPEEELDRRSNELYKIAFEAAVLGGHKEIVEQVVKRMGWGIMISIGYEEEIEGLLERSAYLYYSYLDFSDYRKVASFCPDVAKLLLSFFWERIDEECMTDEIKEHYLNIREGIKYPSSGLGFEQQFLFSKIDEVRSRDEEHLLKFVDRFPNEIVEMIFKHLNLRSRIELIFLYSNRDLDNEELRYIEENEWDEYMPINAKDENGLTMLHKLCYYGHKNKVNFLLEKGALKNLEDKEGKTPLWYAKEGAIIERMVDEEENRCIRLKKKSVEWIEELKSRGLN